MKKIFFRLLNWLKKLILFFFLSTALVVIAYRYINPPFTPLMIIRFFEQSFGPYDYYYSGKWTGYGKISPDFVKAVVASEDQKYWKHNGFDWKAMKSAFDRNRRSGKSTVGGSTISQQVAKNVFLWPGRSYGRKILEAYFTFLIEVCWSKKRILEIYMNKIEMGNGIYGIESASRFYFRKSAAELSRSEAALIAAVLPNPRVLNPAYPTSGVIRKKNWIEIQMKYIN